MRPLPLVFGLALEPLVFSIKCWPAIAGIGHGESERPIGLYADDVILTLYFLTSYNVQVTTESFVYLRINIPSNTKRIHKLNSSDLISKLLTIWNFFLFH